MNAITAATGQTTTSCGHTYHLGCFVRWIMNPEHETCPLCRAVPAEEEKVAPHDETHEEEEEDEEDWGSDRSTNLEIPEFDAENHALWVMRRTFALAEADEHASVSSDDPKPTPPVKDQSYKAYYDADSFRMRTGHYLCPNIDEERGYESA